MKHHGEKTPHTPVEATSSTARHIDRRHNIQLFKMDAARLTFPDQSFDVVYAADVINVVPDPLAVLSEMRRVCRVGDHIVLLNHFRSDIPFLSKVERLVARRRCHFHRSLGCVGN